MIGISTSGSFDRTTNFLKRAKSNKAMSNLHIYGQRGVNALAQSTPVETGLTANSWAYRIVKTRTGYAIEWYNTNKINGTPVAILIQYGHGTKNGGYVIGRDYINPTMRPVFDQIADEMWRGVKS